VIIHRLRIGHTQLTHSYLLSGTDQPECSACHCPLTVKHILIECPALTSTRNKHLLLLRWRTFLIMLLPEILILLKNSIFTALYNVGHVGLPLPPPQLLGPRRGTGHCSLSGIFDWWCDFAFIFRTHIVLNHTASQVARWNLDCLSVLTAIFQDNLG